MARIISPEELAQRNTSADLWIAVDNQVWDITTFLAIHPGGAPILLQHGGQDATIPYSKFHPFSLIKDVIPGNMLMGTLKSSSPSSKSSETSPSLRIHNHNLKSPIPPLAAQISVPDFYRVAPNHISAKANAYISSYACDGLTHNNNRTAYNQILLRPRVLRPVANVSTKTTLFGRSVTCPIIAAPTALAKVVHPDGEKEIARGCARAGVAMALSTGASCDIAEVSDAISSHYLPPLTSTSTSISSSSIPDNNGENKNASVIGNNEQKIPFIFQLYVHTERSLTTKLLQRAMNLGVDAIFLTVDAPVPGKREADERHLLAGVGGGSQNEKKFKFAAPMTGMVAKDDSKGGALGRVMGTFVDADLTWKDVAWVRDQCSSGVRLYVKGIQTAMDARMAMEVGVDGIVVSNHGGRSLDTSPSSILVLLELQMCCPDIFDSMEVLVDGGVMRGTDVFKALCLGAKAVGVGRGVMYGLAWGAEGVEKVFNILKDELEITMKMCGVKSVDELHPGLLNTLLVDNMIPTTDEHPYAKWRRMKSRL